MEYIQCPHCEKKYAVSDKLKAAVGKKIRCKHCQETFEIVLQEAGGKTERKQEPASKKTRKKAVTKNKGPNIQLIITIVLTGILLTGGIVAFLYFNNPDLFKADVKTETSKNMQPAIPSFDPFAKPIGPAPVIQQPEDAASETVEKSDLTTDSKLDESGSESVDLETHLPTDIDNIAQAETNTDTQTEKRKPDVVFAGPKNPTQGCRDAAAVHWMRTQKLSHARMNTKDYMKLFDQGVNQTAEVRKLCKDKSLVVRLTTAARDEKTPEWIRREIETRTDIEEARRKQLESTNR